MVISTEDIKLLREKTGAGISDVKKALEESGGDTEKALKAIERKLGSSALKKSGRETRSGLVDAYIHSDGKIGAMVEVWCETDFVARNPAFKEFVHDLALHVAAMRPSYRSLEEVPKEIWDQEKERFQEEVRGMDKPQAVRDQIVEGKLKAYFGALALLEQPFVKDQDKKVRDVLNETIGRFGENLKIGRFVRIDL